MADPREAKLPKWAQELLEHERTMALVRFPDAPEPPPAAIADENGYGPEGQSLRDFREQYVYSFKVSTFGIYLFKHWVGKTGYLYFDKDDKGFGSRGNGKYYLTEDDARLAARYALARTCAKAMYRAQSLKVQDD